VLSLGPDTTRVAIDSGPGDVLGGEGFVSLSGNFPARGQVTIHGCKVHRLSLASSSRGLLLRLAELQGAALRSGAEALLQFGISLGEVFGRLELPEDQFLRGLLFAFYFLPLAVLYT